MKKLEVVETRQKGDCERKRRKEKTLKKNKRRKNIK